MFTLIVGGAASGKSAYAEALVQRLDGPRVYLATMQPFDEECRARINRHRTMRAEKEFVTMERYRDVGGADVPAGSNLLLECLSNLIANEYFSPDHNEAETIIQGIEMLQKKCRHLTIVTNAIFSGGSDYVGDTMSYLYQLALVNRALAARADLVVEVVAGCTNVLKGAVPPS